MSQELVVKDSPERRILAKLDEAKVALIEATDLTKIRKVRDQAEALRCYAKAQKGCLDLQNDCAELKLIAERRAGEVLRDMKEKDKLDKGGRPPKNRSHDATSFNEKTTLKDIGISKSDAQRWQDEASVPDEKFKEYVKEARVGDKEITQKGLLNLAKGQKEGKKDKAAKETVKEAPKAKAGDITVEELMVQIEELSAEVQTDFLKAFIRVTHSPKIPSAELDKAIEKAKAGNHEILKKAIITT